jgi:type I restriction enzyme S subunit
MSGTDQACILNSICEFIVDCEHKTALIQEEGYPSIRTPNIGRGRLILEGVNRVSEETYKLWTQRAIPREGDLILAREAPVGNVAIIPKNLQVCLGQRTVLIRPDRSKVDPNYLVYLLLGDGVQGKIQSLTGGATVAHLNMGEIRKMELPTLPVFLTQQKIGTILSTYDDLIENNTRRIKILEKMAQAIYREWFVNFRFPGHEGVRMVESEFGKIPEDWKIFHFSDIIESSLGGDWGGEEPRNDENKLVGIIRGTDFKDIRKGVFNELPKRYISESSLTKRKLQSMDIVIENSVNAKSRSAGTSLLITEDYLIQIEIDTIAASFCRVFRPKDPLLSPLIHLHLKNLFIEGKMSFYQNVATNGIANFQTTRLLEKETIVLPNDEQLKIFMLTVLSNLTHSKLIEINANLRRTRDLLLPKLINGELDVSGLDIDIPADL